MNKKMKILIVDDNRDLADDRRDILYEKGTGFFKIILILVLVGILAVSADEAFGGKAAIRVGSEMEFPPFAVVDKNGQADGFSVDLIKAVADTMGLTVVMNTGSWDEMWNGLVSGELDALPLVAKSPDRERLVDFSLTHTETFDSFFVRRGDPEIPDIKSAEGKAIVVMRSDAPHHELAARNFEGELVLVDTIPDGLNMVASGKHDAFLCSKLIGMLAVKKHGIKGLDAGPIIPDYKRVFAFAVKKGDNELREKLNQGLLIVKSNGEYNSIYEKWLTIADPWIKHRKYLLMSLLIATVVALAAIFLSAGLNILIKRRTAELMAKKEILKQEIVKRGHVEKELRNHKENLEILIETSTSALQETLLEYRSLFENMHAGFAYHQVIFDNLDDPKDYVFLEINEAFEKNTGLTRDIIGKKVTDVYPGIEKSDPDFIRIYGKVALTGAPAKFDAYFAPQQHWYTISAYSPKKGFFVAVFDDITGQKQMEENLRRSADIVENIQVGLHIYHLENFSDDRTLRMVSANPASEKYTGVRSDDIIGKTLDENFPGLRQKGIPQKYAEVVRTGTFCELEDLYYGDDRVIFGAFSIKAFPLPNHQVGVSFENITARKKAEEARKESEQFFKTVIQTSPLGIGVVNAEGNLIECNAALSNLIGYDRVELLQLNFADFTHPDDLKREQELIREMWDRKTNSYKMEKRYTHKNGTIIWVNVSAAIIIEDRIMKFAFAFVEDITERRRAEEKLKEYSERLEEMVEERTIELKQAQAELLVKERLAVLGHFAGSISHEIRNPLAAIDSAAYLLTMKLGDGDEKIVQKLKRIAKNVEKTTAIIESLLNLSRMEKPKTMPHVLADVIRKSIRSSKIPSTVEVAASFPDEPVSVPIDAEQIRMALKNIIKNAVQAMDESGTLTVSITPEESGLVEISIADTGPGISEEHIEKVFEPLFSTKTHGIGFGLSIVKMIVENHGGTIRAESPPDGGARFVMTLPQAGPPRF